jgi:hypothetical protein
VSAVLQSAPFFALAAAAFMLIGSLGAGALRVFGRRALARLAPRARYRALFAVSALPLGAAVWLTAVASLPSLIALVDPSMDHCVSHGGEHAHLCFVHLPGTAMRGELVGLIVAAVAYMVCRSAGAGLGVLRASRVTRALVRTSQRDESGALAQVQRDRGPSEVGRENGQRRVVVSCNVAGRDVGSVVRDIEAAVQRSVALPTGYGVAYGGQFESAEDASRTLGWLSLVCVAGMFGLLFTAFGSARDATLVMANLPLALIGGAVGVFLEGGVLSVASLVGFITLFGIATRNGIMLVAHIRHLRLVEGVLDLDTAVRRGAHERLVPILMTALAAGLGLVPLALSGGEPGSELQAPMAVVILCGLLSSTALNMFVVPALYRRFGALAVNASVM